MIVTGLERLKEKAPSDPRSATLYRLLDKNIRLLSEKIHRIQNITRYAAKDYVQGQKIFDIDAGSETLKDEA